MGGSWHSSVCNLVTAPPHKVAPDSLSSRDRKHSQSILVLVCSLPCFVTYKHNYFVVFVSYSPSPFLPMLHFGRWKRNAASEAVVDALLIPCVMLRKALPTTAVGQIEKLLTSSFRRRRIQEKKPQLVPVWNDADLMHCCSAQMLRTTSWLGTLLVFDPK